MSRTYNIVVGIGLGLSLGFSMGEALQNVGMGVAFGAASAIVFIAVRTTIARRKVHKPPTHPLGL